MARIRQVRDDDTLPDDAVLVRMLFDSFIKGRRLDRDELIADAQKNFRLFEYYGLSLWAVGGDWPLDSVLAEKCSYSRHVGLFTAAALRDKGLGLVASGRPPHYDTHVGEVNGVTYGSVQIVAATAEDLVDRFMAASYTVMENHHFRAELS